MGVLASPGPYLEVGGPCTHILPGTGASLHWRLPTRLGARLSCHICCIQPRARTQLTRQHTSPRASNSRLGLRMTDDASMTCAYCGTYHTAFKRPLRPHRQTGLFSWTWTARRGEGRVTLDDVALNSCVELLVTAHRREDTVNNALPAHCTMALNTRASPRRLLRRSASSFGALLSALSWQQRLKTTRQIHCSPDTTKNWRSVLERNDHLS